MATTADIVNAYYEAWAEQRFDDLRATLADDFEFHGPREDITGADAYVDTLRGLGQMITRMDKQLILTGEDDAILLYDWTSKAGQTVRLSSWLHVAEGKIVSNDLLYDSAAMARALGHG